MRVGAVVAGSSVALVALLGTRSADTPSNPPSPAVPLPAIAASGQEHSTAVGLRLTLGDTVRLILSTRDRDPRAAQVARDSARRRRFTSSNSAVATVNREGVVRAVAPGTATIVTISDSKEAADTTRIKVVTPRDARVATIGEVCPNTDGRFFNDTALFHFTTKIEEIHEYHDCQRLIEHDAQGNLAYGPLAGIFAHENVALHEDWHEYQGGMLAAIILNFIGTKRPHPYEPLDLSPGLNCLVIRARSAKDWDAEIVPPTPTSGSPYGDCPNDLKWSEDASAKKLTVQPQRAFDLQHRQIAPPVARWDMDPDTKLNYIGVKCDATTWCEIGKYGFKVSPAQQPKGYPIYKGYYDEQLLADESGIKVSSVFGTVMPGRHTEDIRQMKHYIPRAWHAATMTFTETAAAFSSAYVSYYRKYFAPGATPTSPTFSSPFEIRPSNILKIHSGYGGRLNGNHLVNGSGAVTDSVDYHIHSKSIRVATVRWRWDQRDEKVWSYCDPEGCCENVDTLF